MRHNSCHTGVCHPQRQDGGECNVDTATHCNTLQLTATHCNTLQLTATQVSAASNVKALEEAVLTYETAGVCVYVYVCVCVCECL